MATVMSYRERMPHIYQHRYPAGRWVGWANALLERLSGAGILPPQPLTRGVTVRNGVWVDRPPMTRDVRELRDSRTQSYLYRFAEENGCLRILDYRFPDPERRVIPVMDSGPAGLVLNNLGLGMDDGCLNGWLFVVTAGAAVGHTFIVGDSFIPEENGVKVDAVFEITFLGAGRREAPAQDQNNGNDGPFAEAGYFVPQRDYLILSYNAAYRPVLWISDDLGVSGYENLIDAWFRWKVEEQVSAAASNPDCAYWSGRFESELARLRGERFNRINKPEGRSLAGFVGSGRW